MYLLNGNHLPIDVPFEHEGVSYPSNWLRLTSLEEKEAIGITEVPDIDPIDGRFYNVDGTDRDVETVKNQFIRNFKHNVSEYLSATDWYVIRKIERNIDIPSDVVAERQRLVTSLTSLEVDLSTADTIADVVDVTKTHNLF